ncbi:activating signal cointegrator 1 complex subunit 2 isoform X2 [Cimex lectularius]|uniref:CUE domain-containing protein n=1 Tax=Cimex lectularius TaxID=79782 RepID=A0A8I6S9W6_CIMLE|nr:activating signal cointegrator 1 complex subunit 2 isoform X2 [Cimex lectularius]
MASENPESSLRECKEKSLEALSVSVEEGGVTRKVPALSSYFASNRQMTCFITPPKPNDDGAFVLGAKDSWLSKTNIFKENMQWLLTLPHHRFWSQIIYGKDSWDSVITFLQEAYPYYILDSLPQDPDIKQMYFQIYFLVFRIIKRATTRKESEAHWIGAKKFGSLLYNYTIVSFPILLDVCVVYGESFKDEVHNIINKVFKAQPMYKEDLNNLVQPIKTIFQSLEDLFPERSCVPGELTKLSDRRVPGLDMPMSKIQDVILYLLDVSASLSTFINFYPDAANILHQHKFELNISTLYDDVIPSVTNVVKNQCFNDDKMSTYFNLMLKINHTRYFLITLFHQCLEPILNSILLKSDARDPDLTRLCNNFIDTLSNSFIHSIFITDYNNKFAIESDFEMISQICPELDHEKLNFLKHSLLKTCAAPHSTVPPAEAMPSTSQSTQPVKTDAYANNSPKPKDNQLAVLIEEVKDILPQLGDGFIERCLVYYKYSSADVINAILEDSLPPSLQSLDRELPYIPPELENEIQKEAVPTVNILDFNAFNEKPPGEEMTGYRKKRDDNKSFKDLIDDKSFREEFRNRFSELGIIETLVDIYDDEYDDMYDGEVDVQEVGELDRKFVTPRVLEQRAERSSSESDDEEVEEDENQRRTTYLNFVENPEDVRARYEQRRASKTLKHPHPPRNVAGDSKDTDVLRSRNNKTVHKSSYANHNRKKGAKNKRAHGLLPS